MAIASVTCTCSICGEEFEHRRKKYNSTQAREYAEWAAENVTVCPACWHKQQQEEKKREQEKVLSAYLPLPALTGSEKQIAWADQLRREYILAAERYAAPREARQPAFGRWFRAGVTALLQGKTDSRFWIDTRYESFADEGERLKTLRGILEGLNRADYK